MIQPDSQEKNLQETSTDSVAPQRSVLGFTVNILVVLFWLALSAKCLHEIIQGQPKKIDFKLFMHIYGPVFTVALCLVVFHMYVMIDREYTNNKEYEEDLSLVGALKNHWAIILGTILFHLFVGYWGFFIAYDAFSRKNLVFISKVITVWPAIYAGSGMICWGFITNNKKNILARIVRPWQSHEVAEASV